MRGPTGPEFKAQVELVKLNGSGVGVFTDVLGANGSYGWVSFWGVTREVELAMQSVAGIDAVSPPPPPVVVVTHPATNSAAIGPLDGFRLAGGGFQYTLHADPKT